MKNEGLCDNGEIQTDMGFEIITQKIVGEWTSTTENIEERRIDS